MEVCEHARTVLICTEQATLIKRKRFGTCREAVLCCGACKHLGTCGFVCPAIREEVENDPDAHLLEGDSDQEGNG